MEGCKVILKMDERGGSNFSEWRNSLGPRMVAAGGATAQLYWKFLEKPYSDEVALHEERLQRAVTKLERKEERALWVKFEAAAQTGWNIVLESIETNTQKKVMAERKFLELRARSDGKDVYSLIMFISAFTLNQSSAGVMDAVMAIMTQILIFKMEGQETLEEYFFRFAALRQALGILKPFGQVFVGSVEEIGAQNLRNSVGLTDPGYPLVEGFCVRVLLRGLPDQYKAFKEKFNTGDELMTSGFVDLPVSEGKLLDAARMYRTQSLNCGEAVTTYYTGGKVQGDRLRRTPYHLLPKEEQERIAKLWAEKTCDTCGVKGHIARRCPTKKAGNDAEQPRKRQKQLMTLASIRESAVDEDELEAPGWATVNWSSGTIWWQRR
jgi:hypothetical protein